MVKIKLTEAVTKRHHVFGDRRINKNLHGEAFRMTFDETFDILYCDLKIISGACEWRE